MEVNFINMANEMKLAFQLYYEVTGISEVTDSSVLYDIK